MEMGRSTERPASSKTEKLQKRLVRGRVVLHGVNNSNNSSRNTCYYPYYVLLSSCYVSVCVLPHLRCMILFKPQPIIMNTILQMD